LFTKLLGGSFLPFPHFAAVDHHIMGVALSLDLDLAKFDQSCFHISMFCWRELRGKLFSRQRNRNARVRRRLQRVVKVCSTGSSTIVSEPVVEKLVEGDVPSYWPLLMSLL